MIEITEVKKKLLKKSKLMSYYRVSFRANGNLLYQDMHLNNELPNNILKQELARIAKLHLEKRPPDNGGLLRIVSRLRAEKETQ